MDAVVETESTALSKEADSYLDEILEQADAANSRGTST
jgi:hypothetical protein